MESKNLHANGSISNQPNKDPNGFLPGTTFLTDQLSEEKPWYTSVQPEEPPPSFSGPEINGRPTAVAVYSPRQLINSPLLPSLYNTIILAFRYGHGKAGVELVKIDRLRYENQFLDELGDNSDTRTWIIYYSDSNEVVATASIKRFKGKEVAVDKDYFHRSVGNTWTRLGSIPADTAAWELSTMAVLPELMGQGIAGHLMRMAEDEVKRLFKAASEESRASGGTPLVRLLIMITTLKEKNVVFYSKRGFVEDYETSHEPGHLGSASGFSVIHMSKLIEFGELSKEDGDAIS